MKLEKPIMMGLPKGSLQDATLELFRRAGFNVGISSRSYRPSIDHEDFEVRLLRAQEIAKYVEDGFLDAGITGRDWVYESRAEVKAVIDLRFNRATRSPARWVLVVPKDSPIRSPRDLEGKRIATEVVNLTQDYLLKKGVSAHVEFSWGATEVKAPELVDAIVDITETGSSLQANNLRIVDTLLESYPQLIANNGVWENPARRERIETLALLLDSALNAREKVGLKMNLRRDKLDEMLAALPALRKPTLSPLTDEGWIAIETIIDEVVVREIIPQLKRMGAEGIIEYPLNKVVY